ncbi:MAG: hypothetical protein JWP91_319 [Fibrobacteres bacterium]|nr:hypothetical protein [Fibrobacterota bacterium]
MKNLLILAIVGAFAVIPSHSACGTDGIGTWCESKVLHVGSGANGSPQWAEGVVYVTLSDDQSWFWDNSSAKSMTLSELLTAKSTGQKVQVRWTAGNNGIGSKKITSVLLIPE